MKSGTMLQSGRPIIATFVDLAAATAALHMNERRHLDTLHDVWKKGAPTPDSIVRDPKDYDERGTQVGNHVKRIVLPTMLASWIQDVSAARGMPLDYRQALNMAHGRADYGFDIHDKPLVFTVNK